LKKILLISDTHDYLDPALIKHINYADEVWHAGDIGSTEISEIVQQLRPFRAVHGNIDGAELRSLFPETLVFDCENLKVLITHVGGYPKNYPSPARSLLLEHRPGLFICGHSHILKVMHDKELNLLYMNPGACGKHGFHQIKTALRFEIEAGEVKNLAVIELGKRSFINS